MKKLLIGLLSIVFVTSAMAYDTAKLRMRIAGSVGDNKYFLCIPGSIGCVSILAGNRGKIFPMEVGEVNNIFTVNIKTLRMYTQAIPGSCRVNLNKDQTLTVSGTLVRGAGDRVYLSNMHCSVG